MKIVLLIAVPALALFTWSLSRLSSDAVALALGLTLGVLSIIPATLLVLSAVRRRDSEDAEYIDAPTVYSDEVTPYYRIARRAMGMPQLPDRRVQIAELRAALDYIEAAEVETWNQR